MEKFLFPDLVVVKINRSEDVDETRSTCVKFKCLLKIEKCKTLIHIGSSFTWQRKSTFTGIIMHLCRYHLISFILLSAELNKD